MIGVERSLSALGGETGVHVDTALTSWLALQMGRELRRLAGMGQKAFELRVASTGVVRRPLGSSGALTTVHRLTVLSSFNFSAVQQVLLSPPTPCEARPGFRHCFVVLLCAPTQPALLANYLLSDEAAEAEAELRFFSIVNLLGDETLLEVRDAVEVKAESSHNG